MRNRWSRNFVLSVFNNHLIDYPTPSNISYFWSFGLTASFCLIIQIVTGILLAMHYTPHIDLAFASVEHIMRDVNNGWLIRYLHANGASMFFIMVYSHMLRGLYYGSYIHPREHLWLSGVTLVILMMATAFMGYVLPWGQMSFWGATVITNIFSAIPYIGDSITYILWGGFSVDNPTLNRFFSLHYLVPFLIAAVALIHITLLHEKGSNNPIGVDSAIDKIPFYPYFYVKDLYSVILFLVFYSFFVFLIPNVLGHPDNYVPANPMVTPEHIIPEWYFLPFYAILRSIPDKLGGVIAMAGSLIVLYLIPYINSSEIRSAIFRPLYKKLFWLFVADALILGWIGQNVVETPYLEIGQISTFFYFFYFPFYFLSSFISFFFLSLFNFFFCSF